MLNFVDQHFIIMMIPHYGGEIAVADLALSSANSPEIIDLAKHIKTSHFSEKQIGHGITGGVHRRPKTGGPGLAGFGRGVGE
jgi:uncharacterized protein (DUF305 family)